MTDATNGGGYGNPGAQAQSAQQARAQATSGRGENSPSAQMARDFGDDGHVSQASDVPQEAVTGEGMGLHNQTEAFRSQNQIAYEAEEE